MNYKQLWNKSIELYREKHWTLNITPQRMCIGRWVGVDALISGQGLVICVGYISSQFVYLSSKIVWDSFVDILVSR